MNSVGWRCFIWRPIYHLFLPNSQRGGRCCLGHNQRTFLSTDWRRHQRSVGKHYGRRGICIENGIGVRDEYFGSQWGPFAKMHFSFDVPHFYLYTAKKSATLMPTLMKCWPRCDRCSTKLRVSIQRPCLMPTPKSQEGTPRYTMDG